jgi:hypothetical protein
VLRTRGVTPPRLELVFTASRTGHSGNFRVYLSFANISPFKNNLLEDASLYPKSKQFNWKRLMFYRCSVNPFPTTLPLFSLSLSLSVMRNHKTFKFPSITSPLPSQLGTFCPIRLCQKDKRALLWNTPSQNPSVSFHVPVNTPKTGMNCLKILVIPLFLEKRYWFVQHFAQSAYLDIEELHLFRAHYLCDFTVWLLQLTAIISLKQHLQQWRFLWYTNSTARHRLEFIRRLC